MDILFEDNHIIVVNKPQGVASQPDETGDKDLYTQIKEYLVEKYNTEIHIEKDIDKAYSLAKSITDKEDVVVCAGSLYLIGELYKLARKSEGSAI